MSHKTLSHELKEHIPFTMLGAATGILLMVLFSRVVQVEGQTLFQIFHPLHVVLSAYATTLLYRRRAPQSSVIKAVIIGYAGSIGVATISDSVIPYMGERIMGISVPAHGCLHAPDMSHSHSHDCCPEHEHLHNGETAAQENQYNTGATPQADNANQHTANDPDHSHAEHNQRHIPGKPHIHIGFIEDWALVNLSAIVGIVLGFLFNAGRMPHASHVLVSTWASMAHIMMNTATALTPLNYVGIFIVLFLAVWLPCCLSDIVFPTLFSLKQIEVEQ